jgi:tRNA-binding EMAP/Myf-like protein
MRGIKSNGMVLCASNDAHDKVGPHLVDMVFSVVCLCLPVGSSHRAAREQLANRTQHRQFLGTDI